MVPTLPTSRHLAAAGIPVQGEVDESADTPGNATREPLTRGDRSHTPLDLLLYRLLSLASIGGKLTSCGLYAD